MFLLEYHRTHPYLVPSHLWIFHITLAAETGTMDVSSATEKKVLLMGDTALAGCI